MSSDIIGDDYDAYGTTLLEMLDDLISDGEMYPLGEGYGLRFFSDYEIRFGYRLFYQDEEVFVWEDGMPYGSLRAEIPRQHLLAFTRLLYAQKDTIVARALAQLEALRGPAEARLAQEMGNARKEAAQ